MDAHPVTSVGVRPLEVLAAVSSRERRILISTALLREVSAAQAAALSGTEAAWPFLNRLASEQSFLMRPKSSEADMLEYAPYFRELVLERLEQTLDAKELRALAARASALFETCPTLPWLEDGDELLAALAAWRRGDRQNCHRLLGAVLSKVPHSPGLRRACLVLPAAVAELCNEAIAAGIAPDSARLLIQRYRLPAPVNAVEDWPWPFRVFLLGRFQLLKAGTPIRFSHRAQRKPLELLQALIAFGGTEVGVAALADALWPDSDGDAGCHSLGSALYRLRRLLGASDVISVVDGKLSLDRRQFWVDVWELERELRGGPSDSDFSLRLARTKQLYQGHFLEHEIEKNWALKARLAIRDRYLGCMLRVARSYESQRLWHEAAVVYRSALDLDMLAEDLYKGLMVCYWQLGEHSEALRAYRRCREMLMSFLGVPPSEKTEATYQTIRRSVAAGPAAVSMAHLPVARPLG